MSPSSPAVQRAASIAETDALADLLRETDPDSHLPRLDTGGPRHPRRTCPALGRHDDRVTEALHTRAVPRTEPNDPADVPAEHADGRGAAAAFET
nr:hypothetical protein [Nocardia carnea]